jgi:hypothetical protein
MVEREIEEALVHTSRELYKRGLDLAHDFASLRAFLDIAIENSEKCYASGLLETFWAIREHESKIINDIYNAYFEGKIPGDVVGDAVVVISRVVSTTKDKILDNLKTKCHCKIEV